MHRVRFWWGLARVLHLEPGPELTRPVRVPRVQYEADLTAELRTPGGSIELWPIQSAALQAVRHAGGGFFPIAVGHGKTLIALLSGSVLGARLSIVLTKARIVSQTIREYERAKKHFRMPETRVVSYASLSHKSGSQMLDRLAREYEPGQVVIVCDEAHALAAPTSARTRRILRYARVTRGAFVMLSGTMLRRSVKDCAHLAELALRQWSPLPAAGVYGNRARGTLEAWGECLDVAGRPAPSDWAQVEPLARFGEVDPSLRGAARVRALRAAFAERLRSAPGVVMSGEHELGMSLEIIPIHIEPPAAVSAAIEHVAITDETPNGEPITDDLQRWRIGRELSGGFFYVWDWPGEPDREWLEARSEWARHVRAEINARAATGYDSPALVAEKISEEIGVVRPRAIHRAWERWLSELWKDPPPVRTCTISDYLARDAVALAESIRAPVIIWYESRAMEEMLTGLLPVFGSGSEPPESPAINCACSWRAHGTGRNLQAWHVSIVVEPPSSGAAWEQLLGRMHRPGQTADAVTCYVYQHTGPMRSALASAERAERFVRDSTGERRRLLYADRGEVLER